MALQPTSIIPRCPKCGSALSGSATPGLCPACVLEQSLQEGAEEDVAAPARVFGGYELIEEIARGGMGVVYRARQTKLRREVALKLITSGAFASPESLRRFKAEAELAAGLDHPNIVPIFEIGEHDAQPYFSMGLVRGRTLSARLAEGALEPKVAAELIAKVASAVHFAHQRGILHRDLKPSNILLDERNEPHLSDFGLARLLQSDSTLTHTNAILGTPSYMAPEQARGDTKALSVATDVYGLGAILYECLTASPPFAGGTSIETVRQVLDKEPRSPRTLNPVVEPDLETICLKCLEKDPARRYASAAAVAEDLGRWLEHLPIAARPSSAWERASKAVRRHPGATALLLALACAMIAGVSGVLWQWRAAVAAQARAEQEQYFSSITAAQKFIDEGAVERAREVLLSTPRRLRHWAWGRLMFLASREALTLRDDKLPADVAKVAFSSRSLIATIHQGQTHFWDLGGRIVGKLPPEIVAREIHFSADGKVAFALTADGQVHGFDTTEFSERVQLRGENGFVGMRLSPDGATLALLTQPRQIEFWDLPTERKRGTLAGPFRGAGIFSPDGERFIASEAGRITVWNTGTLKQVREMQGVPGRQIAADSTGDRFALALATGAIAILDAGTGTTNAIISPSHGALQGLSLSANGRRLYGVDQRDWFWLWNAETGALIDTWPHTTYFAEESPHSQVLCVYGGERFARMRDLETGREYLRPAIPAGVWQPAFSPDDQLLALPHPDGAVQIWAVNPHRGYLQNGYSAQAKSVPQRIQKLAYSPDGKQIAAVHHNRTVTVWDAEREEHVETLHGHKQWVLAVEYSPDGTLLATGGGDRTVRLWEASTRAERAVLRGARASINALAFSGNSRKVAAVAQNGELFVWDAQSGAVEKTLSVGTAGLALAWSPTERDLAVSTATNVVIVDTSSWAERNAFAVKMPWALRYSPNGKMLAVANFDGAITLWDAAERRVVKELGGRAPAYALDFTPDSECLAASCSERQTGLGHPGVSLWHVRSGKLICELPGETGQMPALRFAPDGRTLAVGHTRGYIELWNTVPWSEADPGQFMRRYWQQQLSAPRSSRTCPPSNGLSNALPPSQWPARAEAAPPEAVDLTRFHNGDLDLAWHYVTLRNELEADFRGLPRGLQLINKIAFDIRAAVQLASGDARWQELFPSIITNIPLASFASRLHFLHGAVGEADARAPIGEYQITYKNGQTKSIPIQLGSNVTVSWRSSTTADEQVPAAQLVYKSWSSSAVPINTSLQRGAWGRIYLYSWTNPHPEWELDHLDFVSGHQPAAPFLLALTIEPNNESSR